MSEKINIYCDESCHLEHDRQPVMLFGAIWCPESHVKHNIHAIKALKEEYRARGEIKWTKVSFSRCSFFLKVVDLFFSTSDLNFRCLVINNKKGLDHSYYNKGDHDSFYYKMYFYILRNIISIENRYNIYLDIKDTRSQLKINKLRDVLCNNIGDFDRKVILNIQHIRSKESELLQLADLLMGAVSYVNRNLSSSESKGSVAKRIRQRSGLDLQDSTPPWEDKFNLFFFSPREIPK
jgi:hypothetical protein